MLECAAQNVPVQLTDNSYSLGRGSHRFGVLMRGLSKPEENALNRSTIDDVLDDMATHELKTTTYCRYVFLSAPERRANQRRCNRLHSRPTDSLEIQI